jgi:TRAP-type C4-dicarboxylate transport system permease large subunit
MQRLGINSLQFGVIMIVGMAVGLVTPPIGMCLNATTKICRLPIMEIFRNAIPLVLCNVAVLLVVTFFPGVYMWLPKLLMQ